jgi:hypothetical protein
MVAKARPFYPGGFNRSTQHCSAGALWHGAGTILPLSANILDIASVPRSVGRRLPTLAAHPALPQLSFCFGVNHVLACPLYAYRSDVPAQNERVLRRSVESAPQHQTSAGDHGTSALCQKRKLPPVTAISVLSPAADIGLPTGQREYFRLSPFFALASCRISRR